MKKAEEYEIVDHGIQHSQYFQGCGTAFTPYEMAVTGIGDNFAEAIDDALENLAQCGYDAEELETRIMEDNEWDKYPQTLSVSDIRASERKAERENDEDEESFDDDCDERYYHVSIRVK